MHETERDAALEEELRALAPLLDRAAAPTPPPGLVEQTLARASAELARSPAIAPGVAASASTLPVGFRRELLRLVAVTLPVLAVVLAWDVFLLTAAPDRGRSLNGEALPNPPPSGQVLRIHDVGKLLREHPDYQGLY